MTHSESSQNSLQGAELWIQLICFAKENKDGLKLSALFALLCIWIILSFPDSKKLVEIVMSIGGGFFTGIIFFLWQDFSQKKLLCSLDSDLVFSWKWGTKLHPNHNKLPHRKEMIELLDKEFKLLTTTADNYLRGVDSTTLQSALHKGVKVKFLLHTPLLYLRDFVTDAEDGLNVGQHRKHSSEIIREHLECSIPEIKKLIGQFPKQVDVQFFTYRHAINMAIYDQRRIFGAFLLGKTKGSELPCIEISQGVSSHTAFDIFEKEFDDLWKDKRNLKLDNVIEIYHQVFDGITANDLINKKPLFEFEHAERIRIKTQETIKANLAASS